MIQLCRKDKEKVYDAIRSGKIDAAELALPDLIDDIILTIKKCLRHINSPSPSILRGEGFSFPSTSFIIIS